MFSSFPVGGFYTVDGVDARKIVSELNPKIVIPMHFKTPALNFPIDGVESFLAGLKNVEFLNKNWIELDPYLLPKETKVVVMQYRKKEV